MFFLFTLAFFLVSKFLVGLLERAGAREKVPRYQHVTYWRRIYAICPFQGGGPTLRFSILPVQAGRSASA
jgi:hypothetical protein